MSGCPSCGANALGFSKTSLSLHCMQCGTFFDYQSWLLRSVLVPLNSSSDPNKTPPLYPQFDLPSEPEQPKSKEYARCIKCRVELCEALDRTPEDPPGELWRCIRCKDGRKYTRGGSGQIW